VKSFPHLHQPDKMDCGAACLAMVAKYHGKTYTIQKLRDMCSATRSGVSMLGISDAAEKLGLKTMGVRLSFNKLAKEVPLPCIVHWRQEHFVVVYSLPRPLRKRGVAQRKCATNSSPCGGIHSTNSSPCGGGWEGVKKGGFVRVADPAHGLIQFTPAEFCNHWLSTKKDGEDEGIALLLEPTPAFYEQEDEKSNRAKFSFIFRYLKPYKRYIVQLFLGLILGSLLQLIFPFLTQSIVDYGISNQNLGFVTLILIAQLVLFSYIQFFLLLLNLFL